MHIFLCSPFSLTFCRNTSRPACFSVFFVLTGDCNTIIVTPDIFTTLYVNFPHSPHLRRALLVRGDCVEGYNPDALTCNIVTAQIQTAFVGLLILTIETTTRSFDLYPFNHCKLQRFVRLCTFQGISRPLSYLPLWIHCNLQCFLHRFLTLHIPDALQQLFCGFLTSEF